MIPAAAHAFLPLLVALAGELWPSAHEPWTMAAQVEKETCITLTHKGCWSPTAELKTSRENGIGFGQITRAYNADGSIRFDKQAELRAAHQELRGWTWELRYDPRLQMTGLVLMDRSGWTRFEPLSATPDDTWAMTLSGYNGGDGGVLKDRLLCKKEPACDPTRWSGNVERYSTKSRAKWQGYGQSAYDINRGYVRRVLQRAPDYEPSWEAWKK